MTDNSNQNRYGEKFWYKHFIKWKHSGDTLSGYARKHQINKSSFHSWKTRFLSKAETKTTHHKEVNSGFQEASFIHTKFQSPNSNKINFYFPNGCYLSFHEDFNEDQLYRILTNWI